MAMNKLCHLRKIVIDWPYSSFSIASQFLPNGWSSRYQPSHPAARAGTTFGSQPVDPSQTGLFTRHFSVKPPKNNWFWAL